MCIFYVLEKELINYLFINTDQDKRDHRTKSWKLFVYYSCNILLYYIYYYKIYIIINKYIYVHFTY